MQTFSLQWVEHLRYPFVKAYVQETFPVTAVGVTMTVMNTANLNKYRRMAIENTDLTNIRNGIYYGEAKVGSYIYKVEVEVSDHKIINIKGIDNRKSPYVTYAEGVFSKIIKKQNANVDAVTGLLLQVKLL